jgi:hypothetical protein
MGRNFPNPKYIFHENATSSTTSAQRCYDTGIPFSVDVDDADISTSSDTSKSFADGTAAEAAAPKAVWFCPGGATSLAR